MDVDTNNQIKQMTTFIISEAKEKALDISKKGEEEFSIEVHRLITEGKEKERQTYEKKRKEIETKYAIQKSMAINKQRLDTIKERQQVMGAIVKDSEEALMKAMENQGQSKTFITKLIVQGLLMLLESEVRVQCRQADVKLVTSCLEAAAKEYQEIVKSKSGATKTCKLILDDKNFLPPAPAQSTDGKSCLGGIALSCFNGKITIDNTIDARLQLVMEQDKPAIRGLLFPGSA
jgi:V-type H+-transporting ATPase subunit E